MSIPAEQLARPLSPSDYAACLRCGTIRRIRPDRDTDLCRDCKIVETLAQRQAVEAPAGRPWTYRGVTTWAVPMSDEDRQWCERAAQRGLLIAWERANRAGGDERLQRQIERTWAA